MQFPIWMDRVDVIVTIILSIAALAFALWLHYNRYLHLSVSAIVLAIVIGGDQLCSAGRHFLLGQGCSETAIILIYGIAWVLSAIIALSLGGTLQPRKFHLPEQCNLLWWIGIRQPKFRGWKSTQPLL